jgi:hypothetical protein
MDLEERRTSTPLGPAASAMLLPQAWGASRAGSTLTLQHIRYAPFPCSVKRLGLKTLVIYEDTRSRSGAENQGRRKEVQRQGRKTREMVRSSPSSGRTKYLFLFLGFAHIANPRGVLQHDRGDPSDSTRPWVSNVSTIFFLTVDMRQLLVSVLLRKPVDLVGMLAQVQTASSNASDSAWQTATYTTPSDVFLCLQNRHKLWKVTTRKVC